MPAGYQWSKTIDLEENKKEMLLVNGLAILVAAAMVVPMLFLVPIQGLFKLDALGFGGLLTYILRFAALVAGGYIYVMLHEFTHGLVMKMYGAKKVKFGFTALYAFAGSKTEYFRKWPYIVVALTPVTVFFIIFALICPFIYKTPWFWVVYFWQIQNISGAVGDIFVSLMIIKKPKNSYIQDQGTCMKVFVPKEKDEDLSSREE